MLVEVYAKYVFSPDWYIAENEKLVEACKGVVREMAAFLFKKW